MNIHPHTHVSFDKWLEVLDKRGFLSAEQFFDNMNFLYDAMPDFWKKLTVDHRQKVIQIIDDVYKSVPANKKVCTKGNVLKLVKYVKLGELFRLRACYMTAKKDATVIARVKYEVSLEL